MQDVAVGIGLGAGRESELTEKVRHHAGDLRAALIPAHGLGAGNPVVAARPFHRVEALVDQHHDGILVIHLDFGAVVLVGIPGIARDFADPGQVGAQEIR